MVDSNEFEMYNTPMIKGSCILQINPHKKGIKKRPGGWLVGICDIEIAKYYRKLYYMETYKLLNIPAWGAHISIIRDECSSEKLKQFENLELTYSWEPSIISDDVHFWLPAYSQDFDLIREKLELGPPLASYHITILNKKGLNNGRKISNER